MVSFQQKMVVISAPSGCGKTTLAHALLRAVPSLSFSISACTRRPRSDEKDGLNYYFMTRKTFEKKIAEKAFLEWEEVYEGQLYGTLHSELKRLAAAQKHVLFDIDVKGGQRIKAQDTATVLSVFIRPPSLKTLEERLRKRGTENEKSITYRLNRAEEELQAASHFDYVLTNDMPARASKVLIHRVLNFLESPKM